MNEQNKQSMVVSISTLTFLKMVVVLFVLGFVWLVRDILFLLLIAIILAAAFDPLVDWFQKKKIPRVISILGIYLVLIGIFSLAIGLIVPLFIEQMNELLKNLPGYINQLAQWFTNIQATAIEYGVFEEIKSSFINWQADLGKNTSGGVLSLVGGVFGGVVSLFSVLVMTFYMVIEEDNTKKFIISISPSKYQDYLIPLMDKISLRMGRWLRGQLILSFLVGFLVYIGLSILGIKYAFVLALIAAITEIIPYIGPLLGAFPGVLISFTISPLIGVFTILLYFIIQQIENGFLMPKIMSKTVGLNPVIVIISILIGAKIGGPIGAIISIPVSIILSIFFKDIIDYPWQYKGTQE
jgi:predicted PurR-regulated permease PerM